MDHLSENDLNEYIDEVLLDAARKKVETHLEACRQCQERLAGLEKVGRLLASLPQVQPVPDLQAAVRGAIVVHPQRLGFGWKVVLAVQGGVLLAVGLLSARSLVGWAPLLGAWEVLAGQCLALQVQLPRLTLSLPSGFPSMPGVAVLPAVLALLAGGALLWAAGNALLLRGLKERRP